MSHKQIKKLKARVDAALNQSLPKAPFQVVEAPTEVKLINKQKHHAKRDAVPDYGISQEVNRSVRAAKIIEKREPGAPGFTSF